MGRQRGAGMLRQKQRVSVERLREIVSDAKQRKRLFSRNANGGMNRAAPTRTARETLEHLSAEEI